jgi:hypothetical protein
MARPGRQNPQPSLHARCAAMIGSRSADRIKAAVMRTAETGHMTAPAERGHPKKSLQQGSHPHMTARQSPLGSPQMILRIQCRPAFMLSGGEAASSLLPQS